MIKYQRISGVRLDDSVGLPTIVRTPEGRAMGSIPGWRLLLDPAYIDPEAALWARNRAAPSSRANIYGSGANDFIPIGEFPGSGQPAFVRNDDPVSLFRVFAPAAWNPYQWTMFAVTEPTGSVSAQRLAQNEVPGEAGAIAPYITISSNLKNFTIFEQDTGDTNTPRLQTSVSFDGPSLLMATFSTRDGLRQFKDGTQIAAEPSDTRPLTHGYGPNEWTVFRNANGYWGMTGMLGIDLGAPEHIGYRRAVERFLMTKYQIPAS